MQNNNPKVIILPFDNPQFFADARRIFHDEIAKFDDAQRAYRLVRYLKEWLRAQPHTEQGDTMMRSIDALLVRAMFVAFHMLSENEAVDLLRHHFLEHKEVGVDMVVKFRAFLRGIPDYDERDKMREAVLKALTENDSVLLSISPAMNVAGHDARNVGRIAREYLAAVGMERVNAAKREEYLAHAFHWTESGKEDEAVVRSLVSLVEYLKISSWSMASGEDPLVVDDGGRLRVVEDDGVHDIEPLDTGNTILLAPTPIEVSASNAMVELLRSRYESWQDDSMIAQAWGALRGAVAGDSLTKGIPGILDAFYRGINMKNPAAVLESIWRLGRAGVIRSALVDSDRYRKYWTHYLEKHAPTDVEGFKKNPAASEHLVRFLRHVLEDRLKMPEEQSKLAMLTLSNECRKAGEEEYSHLAYGDLETGEFRWNA